MTTLRFGVPLVLAMLAGGGAAVAQEAPQILRATAAGQPVKLRNHGLSEACSGIPPTISFTLKPTHGTVDIKPERFIFGKGYVSGPNKSCEGQPVDGEAIWYTPAPGFHGVDKISWTADFQGTSKHHRVDNYSAQVTVQ